MKVIGKDRTSCDVCNPIDEILARLDALERRASAIVAKVQGLAPDGEGNVTLPTSSSDTDPLHGRVDAFAMSSEVKEAADDAHAYAASIADDVVVINSEIEAIEAAIQTLQTADTKNVKINVAQDITGRKTIVESYPRLDFKSTRGTDTGSGLRLMDTVDGSQKHYLYMYPDRIDIPSPSIGASSAAIVNKAYVESTDGSTNNLVHRSANEKVDGIKTFIQRVDFDSSTVDLNNPPSYANRGMSQVNTGPNLDVVAMREEMMYSSGGNSLQFTVHARGEDEAHTDHTASLMLTVFRDGTARLRLVRESGAVEIVPRG